MNKKDEKIYKIFSTGNGFARTKDILATGIHRRDIRRMRDGGKIIRIKRGLYRLAISKFSDHFVLKGGLLLICLKIPRSRATKDIDFLAEQVKNDPAELESILKNIADLHCDDGVKFNSLSITSERIKEDTDYEGIRLKIDATLGQARKRLQMDIGFGDVIIPKARVMEFPTLLEEKSPKVKVYSIESIISEKFIMDPIIRTLC